MLSIPEINQNPKLPPEIDAAAKNGELVLFIGAGASRLVGLPSWSGLASKALGDLRKKGLLDYSELEQLKKLDPKKQLSIAEIIAKKIDFKRDLKQYLNDPSEESDIYLHINKIGCTCVTTNYDEQLKPSSCDTTDDSTAGITRIYKKEDFPKFFLNKQGSVIHLHGAISDYTTMIVTTKDYLEHYDFDEVQEFLKDLFVKKTVLFLGYGLEENEILEHIFRRGSARSDLKKESRERKRFLLQGFFKSENSLYKRLGDYYEASFGVHLIGFERDINDFRQLEEVIKLWAQKIDVKKPALTESLNFLREVLDNE